MAIYAIGDLHGSLVALTTIFKQGTIKKEDTVVFLGDYVDRGPDSRGVLDWLIDNRENYNFKFLLGNHDIMMSAARNSADRFAEWLAHGGANTLDSYGIHDNPDWALNIPATHWEFLNDCLPYYAVEKFIFVHGGLEPGKPLKEQDEHHLFWKKYEKPEMYSSDKTVICGHTSRKNGEIADFGHTICIDTFAHGGKWLSCLNVETKTFIQSNNFGEFRTG